MIVDLMRPLKSECPTSAHIESNFFNFKIPLLPLILVIKISEFIYLDLVFLIQHNYRIKYTIDVLRY